MKKQLILFLVSIIPFCATAQLSKQMSKYHKKSGVSVTQLDKSLYGLYQRENLSPEAREMLQQLDEVNMLNLDLNTCEPATCEKIISQFRTILDNSNDYKLVKSRNNGFGEQFIYTRNDKDKISDLVVWNSNPQQLDIIELRGNIETEKIALLSKALNIKGLNSLASLSSGTGNEEDTNFGEIMKLRDQMPSREEFLNGFNSIFGDFFGHTADTTIQKDNFFDPFGQIDEMMSRFDDIHPEQFKDLMGNMDNSHTIEKFFQSFGDGNHVSSSSVRITEENGKTKLKIDSKNTDITYIIDGKQVPKDNVQMPEKILNVNIIPSREDMKKSYLFVTSQNKIGSFTSYKEGVLTFQYDNQQYQFNLDKVQEPLLVIDGRLASTFNLDPSDIQQIRPISQIEKEVGYYPNAAVIINTK